MNKPAEEDIQRRQQEKKATIAAFHELFAQRSAELVLKNLSKECYENELTFVKGDPSGSAFNSGKRYVILHIRRLMAKKLDTDKQEKAVL